MITRRRLFALPGALLASLPQTPWERHQEQPEMTPRELTDGHYQHEAAINTHTWMLRAVHGRLRWLEQQILQPGRRPKGGVT